MGYSVTNRDNQRRVGLYHEIIYEAEVVYQINDRGAAEVSLSDNRPKLKDYFIIKTDSPLIIPIDY